MSFTTRRGMDASQRGCPKGASAIGAGEELVWRTSSAGIVAEDYHEPAATRRKAIVRFEHANLLREEFLARATP
jgi:hypothetical protein